MDDGARTRDTRSHSPALYQLSYIHHPRLDSARNDQKLARLEGIEPPTDGLEIRCSILLSYRRGVHVDSGRHRRDRGRIESRGERI